MTWRRGGRSGQPQSATFPTRQLAEAANALCRSRQHLITAAEVEAAVYGVGADPAAAEAVMPTLKQWSKEWFQQRRDEGAAQLNVVKREESIARRRILPKLGHYPLDQITPKIVSNWVGWLRTCPMDRPNRRKETISTTMVHKTHAVLHAMLEAAVPEHIPYNPAAKKTGRRKSGLPKKARFDPVFLTDDEIKIILAACKQPLRDMVAFSLLTGIRNGELLALQVQDVVFGEPSVLQIRRARKENGEIGPPKSERSRRDISLPDAALKILQPRIEGRPPTALLFPAIRGGIWNPANLRMRQWMPALARAQRCAEHPPPLPPKPATGPRRQWRIDEVSTCSCPTRLHRVPRWHDLRQTAGSRWIRAGKDIVWVSHRLGHESVATTARFYAHLSRDLKDDLSWMDTWFDLGDE